MVYLAGGIMKYLIYSFFPLVYTFFTCHLFIEKGGIFVVVVCFEEFPTFWIAD